jgi:hypothetical protein
MGRVIDRVEAWFAGRVKLEANGLLGPLGPVPTGRVTEHRAPGLRNR